MSEDTVAKRETTNFSQEFFQGRMEIPFVHKRTGKEFLIKSIDQHLEISDHDLERLVLICNEKPIYKRFFEEKLKGKPYSTENAQTIVRLAREGWQKKEWFIFFVYNDQNEISGLIDLYERPQDKPVRIGYWNSSHHPGLMSYALEALLPIAKKAEFKKLFATPKADNASSQRVLENNGFKRVESYFKEGVEWYRYVLDFSHS